MIKHAAACGPSAGEPLFVAARHARRDRLNQPAQMPLCFDRFRPLSSVGGAPIPFRSSRNSLIMLKGTELLDAIRSMETASRSEQCLACGYVRQDGKPAFTSFFEAILEARGVITAAQEKEELLAEYKDSDELETLQELLEDYSADAVRAFNECFGDGELEGLPIPIRVR